MGTLRHFLLFLQRHKTWGWFGLLIYACVVTFPHQSVQNVVGAWAARHTLKNLYRISAGLAFVEAALMIILFGVALRRLRAWTERRWLLAFWILSLALMAGAWRMFMANNTELVHYPQYFPEGMALMALTLSPTESLAWIALLGGLDEAFQYTFLVKGKPFPYDFNDVYMDLVGGAAGIVFAMAVLGCGRRMSPGWAKKLFARPGIVVMAGTITAGIILWASGKMLLYEAPGSPPHWFSLSRLRTPTFWYFSPVIWGPHHFHEMSPIEGPILILLTIAVYALLDRRIAVLPEQPVPAPERKEASVGN
jgi:hypothetical protein